MRVSGHNDRNGLIMKDLYLLAIWRDPATHQTLIRGGTRLAVAKLRAGVCEEKKSHLKNELAGQGLN